MFEFATLGIRRFFRDASKFQRERIGDGDVAGDMSEKTGFLGADGVELLARREFLVGPERVIPSAASDPVAFFVRGNGGGDAFLQFFDSWHAVKRTASMSAPALPR